MNSSSLSNWAYKTFIAVLRCLKNTSHVRESNEFMIRPNIGDYIFNNSEQPKFEIFTSKFDTINSPISVKYAI